MRICWIDDDAYRTKELKDILVEYLNYYIDFYENYEEALRFLEEQHFEIDLLMLDIRMPSLDLLNVEETLDGKITGLVLIEKIRKIYSGPILLYSVLRDEKLINQYKNNDPKISSLIKPASADEIELKIQKLTQSKNLQH